MDHLDQPAIQRKTIIIIRICCVFWIVAKFISWDAWTAGRLFPVIAPFDSFTVPNEIHVGLLIISTFGLLFLYRFPERKVFSIIVVCSELLSCMLDQMRWQPWEYQYLLTLMFLIVSHKDKNLRFLRLVGLLVAATYFFSGIHKFSGNFLHVVWDTMFLHQFLGLPNGVIANPLVHYAGLLISAIECGAAMMLVFAKNKKPALYLLVTMHLLVLVFLSPFGLNYNVIVWPWNLAMIAIIWTLYSDNMISFQWNFFTSKLNIAAVTVVVLLPMSNFFGYWDDYVSFNLYSGKTKNLMICVNNPEQYPELQKYFVKKDKNLICPNSRAINVDKWGFAELSLPIYPEEKTFEKLKKAFNDKFPASENTFVMYWYPYGDNDRKEIH